MIPSPKHSDHRYGSMEDGHGQDVVAHSHTTWAIQKRSASPLDADTQTSKRPWNSAPFNRVIRQPLPNERYQGYASPLRNAASWGPSGAISRSHPLVSPANNNGLSHLHHSSYGSTAPRGVFFSGIRGQHHLAGSEGGFASLALHDQPIIYHPEGETPGHILQLQSSATDIPGSGLSLAPAAGSFPLGPPPADADGHTPSYPPDLAVRSGSDIAYLASDMRVSIAHDVDRQNHFGAPCPEAHHAQEHISGPWPVPLHCLSHNYQLSTEEVIDYTQRPLPPISSGGGGYLAESTHSLNTFNGFSNNSAMVPHHYAAPVMNSDSSNAAFSHCQRHSSMSVHPTRQEHDSWADHDSLTLRLAMIQQCEQQTQQFGRYVEVVHPLGGRYNAHVGGTANSDVEETVTADDGGIGAKVKSVRSSISSTSSAGDLHPYSPSSNSSYVNISSPSSIRQDNAQHALYSGNNHTTESTGAGDRSAVPGNPALEKKPRKKRSGFERDKREETKMTRVLKACVACRKQKIRCTVNEDGPAAPCAKCQKTTTSKSGKVIHRSVCFRTLTVTSIIAVRPGGLGLTRRWEGTKMADVTDHVDNAITTIQMLQGLSRRPIVVQVRKFKPKEGDIIYREWDDNGAPKRLDLEPYCLVDIHATATYFSNYLYDTALEGLKEAARFSGELVQETFRMVHSHAAKLSRRMIEGPDTEVVTKEWQMLMRVVKLVWSMRHTTGSVWLHGPEKLGMTPPEDDSFPLNSWTGEKEVWLPRLIVAQFDSIQNQRILPSQLKRVLDDLEKNLSSPKHDWFTMYLAVFMLLHEISVASKDRYRWARERQQKTRYGAGKYAALGMYMENFQKASYPLLAYWHYYKCNILDDAMNASGPRTTTRLQALEPEQVRFMEWSAQLMREAEEANKIPKPPLLGCWEHELFFVSRMFRRDWMEGFQTFNFMDK